MLFPPPPIEGFSLKRVALEFLDPSIVQRLLFNSPSVFRRGLGSGYSPQRFFQPKSLFFSRCLLSFCPQGVLTPSCASPELPSSFFCQLADTPFFPTSRVDRTSPPLTFRCGAIPHSTFDQPWIDQFCFVMKSPLTSLFFRAPSWFPFFAYVFKHSVPSCSP